MLLSSRSTWDPQTECFPFAVFSNSSGNHWVVFLLLLVVDVDLDRSLYIIQRVGFTTKSLRSPSTIHIHFTTYIRIYIYSIVCVYPGTGLSLNRGGPQARLGGFFLVVL